MKCHIVMIWPECAGFQYTKGKLYAIPECICYHQQIGWPKLDILWHFFHLFACWVIFNDFLLSSDFFSK